MASGPTRELARADLAVYRDLRAPLSDWLRTTHGRGDQRAGLLGLVSAITGLVGMYGFGVSPLLAALHVLLALLTDGIAPRMAAYRLSAASAHASHRFLSPGQALAFARAVREALGGNGSAGERGRIALRVSPQPADSGGFRTGPTPQNTPWARFLTPLVWLVLALAYVLVALLGLLILGPLAQATTSLFDSHDWWGLAILLVINLGQIASNWRELSNSTPDAPWRVAWLTEPPALGDILLWRQMKTFPLVIAAVLAFLLAVSPGSLANYYKNDPAAFATALDAQLLGLVSGLFVFLGLLHALLLAAPWHARRRIAELNSVQD